MTPRGETETLDHQYCSVSKSLGPTRDLRGSSKTFEGYRVEVEVSKTQITGTHTESKTVKTSQGVYENPR